MPSDSFAKYEAEVAIRLYSEPNPKDFEDHDAYLAALETWIDKVEKAGELDLEDLFENHKKKR